MPSLTAFMPSLSPETAERSLEQYCACLAAPATRTFGPEDYIDTSSEQTEPRPVTIVLQEPRSSDHGHPLVFVVPHLLTAAECAEVMEAARAFGMQEAEYSLRTARRTKQYMNEALAKLLAERLPNELVEVLNAEADNGTTISGIHPNVRVVEYESGQAFPAHVDQMDTHKMMTSEGVSDLHVSTHTLLVNLSDSASVQGGCTRFFPDAHNYAESVDVTMPQGWAVVFKQKGLLHCGMPVHEGVKVVANCSIMRPLPPGAKLRPHIFRWGPGMMVELGRRMSSNSAGAGVN